MDIVKICKGEAISLIVIATINQLIIGVPKTILLGNRSASLLNIVLIALVAIVLVLLLSYLFNKFTCLDIVSVSEILGGKILKNFTAIAYWGFFLFSNVICLKYIVEFLKTIYFQDNSIVFLSLFFLVAIAFAIQKSFNSISKVTLVCTLIGFFNILILFIGSIPNFIPERIFPILGTGADKVFFSNLTNIFAFSGISYLMFLMPMLKNIKDFKQIGLYSVIISFILLFISVACLLLSFPFITTSQDVFSLYFVTRIIEYEPFFERADAIFIFFGILYILSYLSINLYFMLKNFQSITKIKNPNAMSFSFCAIILGFTILIKNVAIYYFLYNKIYVWYFIILTLISFLILVLANLKKGKSK